MFSSIAFYRLLYNIVMILVNENHHQSFDKFSDDSFWPCTRERESVFACMHAPQPLEMVYFGDD